MEKKIAALLIFLLPPPWLSHLPNEDQKGNQGMLGREALGECTLVGGISVSWPHFLSHFLATWGLITEGQTEVDLHANTYTPTT